MYAFSNASCKVTGVVSAGFGASCGFGVEPFGSAGSGFTVSAGFTSAGLVSQLVLVAVQLVLVLLSQLVLPLQV